ncbi:pyridoxal phosphate-dependent aminotransferase [Actinacidiphila yeochonensis]|uniref:pyridoxal phosphate-dependent aminotransferase n=1 Tax=Actinacidiphila yeochonensis TaxID=89050 RepID=UPI00068B25DE|nr:pyridoxal phosphate-dependent aminotransferase [Actinacidiphila yeochonensis]
MTDLSALFSALPPPSRRRPPTPAAADATSTHQALARAGVQEFGPDEYLIEVFERAPDPTDAMQLRDLYLGRIEQALGARSSRPELAEAWRAARHRRTVTPEQVLASRATVRFVKEMFNFYFRDDLYGSLRRSDHLILSSGAVDEEEWGLPAAVKECVTYALSRDWYGYSDSRGREPAREAIAAYESARLGGAFYDLRNVALTMGGTFAISGLTDFVLTGRRSTAPALCAIPNYPPLIESMSRRSATRLVPTPLVNGVTSLAPLLEQLRPDTPLVLLQTATNPTGALVDEAELEALIKGAGPDTVIVLDECHEWLGPSQRWSPARAAANVVRVSSLSKNWSAPGLKLGWILAGSTFIDAFYEYASSSYGGPPSFFYTAVEVLARMERWRFESKAEAGPSELAEFETGYGLTADTLRAAYAGYLEERDRREQELLRNRDTAVSRLRGLPDTEVTAPRYSINLVADFEDYSDSYLAFRDLLDLHDVSVFPGLLTFCLSGGLVRLTTARRWTELTPALSRIERFRRTPRPVGSLPAER